jgi:hypothetical protein
VSTHGSTPQAVARAIRIGAKSASNPREDRFKAFKRVKVALPHCPVASLSA